MCKRIWHDDSGTEKQSDIESIWLHKQHFMVFKKILPHKLKLRLFLLVTNLIKSFLRRHFICSSLENFFGLWSIISRTSSVCSNCSPSWAGKSHGGSCRHSPGLTSWLWVSGGLQHLPWLSQLHTCRSPQERSKVLHGVAVRLWSHSFLFLTTALIALGKFSCNT
jgi:hypothetical protein